MGLRQDLKKALVKLPGHFDVELCYKEHKKAEKASFFPGVKRESDCIVSYKSDNYFEVLRALQWLV